MKLLIAILVKPFGVAKARLHPVLNAEQRSRLGKTVAANTVDQARATGYRVAVVTADHGVARWAKRLGVETVMESAEFGSGLDGAAAAASAYADRDESAWLILPADLPLLTVADLTAAIDHFGPTRYVMAPSYNGGTALLMGTGAFPFSYGPGSFHRHIGAAAGRAHVVVRTGLALDLDTPRDLEVARRLSLDRVGTAL